MTLTREPIFSALFDLVWPSADAGTTFKNDRSTARTLRHWNDVAPEEMPALFLAQGAQSVAQTAVNGLPTKWHLNATLYAYTKREGDLSPGEVLNPILDVLSGKLEANAAGFAQRLGGLVQWARIEGTIETSEGTLGDLEVALVPVKILTV